MARKKRRNRTTIFSIAALFMISVFLIFMHNNAQARTADNIQYSTTGSSSLGLEGISINGATDTAVGDALGLLPEDVISISFGTSDPVGFEVFGTAATLFPTQGSDYFVMSSGATASALTPNTSESTSTVLGGLNNSQGNDMVQTVLVLQPPVTASCLAMDFAFYSEEFPEFVGSQYNDAFVAEIGTSNIQIINDQVVAPNNFAFDSLGNAINVNTVLGVNAANASGTTYDGGTGLLTAKTPLATPGAPITITLSILDLGDSIYDSTVFVDNIRWLFGIACEPGADTDTDRDALLDGWETDGIDLDNDGTVDLDLPAMGADPLHKDIFVEVDYMVDTSIGGHTHQPKADALQIAIDAFESAPVANPDGTTGIRIHIDAGPNSIMNPITNETWGTFSRSDSLTHQANLGACPAGYDWTAFDAIKSTNFSTEREAVFHYNIWAHSLCSAYGTTSGISRGIPASDFLVTLGGWSGDVGNVGQQAGTFMHELGHGLSYRHGGDDHGNREPNYLSVMSYSFQTRGLRILGSDGNYDYSRFKLPALDESNLDETIGIMGVAEAANYGTRYFDPSGTQRVVDDINGPIDWNFDGDATDVGISVDINFSGGMSILDNSDNWDEIDFRGGAIGALGEDIDLPVVVPDPENGLVDIQETEDSGLPADIWVKVTGPSLEFLAPGKSNVYSYRVTNIGDTEQTFDIDATAIKSWADLSQFLTSRTLLPDEYSIINIPITVPLGTPGGSIDFLTLSVQSQTNPSIMDSIVTETHVSNIVIDIMPGSDKNPINNKKKGVIPVAILGSNNFDVRDVDITTLTFGPGEATPAHLKNGQIGDDHYADVNADGYTDLVTHYWATAAAIDTAVACLRGQLLSGTLFGDCDNVKK